MSQKSITFKLEDYEGFNKFVEKHSPRGQNGVKVTNSHFVVFYEDANPMSNLDKIAMLRFELGVHLEKMVQYDKQMRNGKKMRDRFKKDGTPAEKEGYAQMNSQYVANVGMIKLEISETETVVEMLEELGEKIKVDYPTLPDLESENKQEPVPSSFSPGKKKKGK